MREESHLDEMRSALRGDFERLAQRRGGQELLRVQAAGEEDEPEKPPDERGAEPEEARSSPEDGAEPVARRSWIDRLLAR